jgi:hypothetical protein
MQPRRRLSTRSLVALAVAAGALAAYPTAGSAAVTVAIGENQPAFFGDPLFQQTGIRHARLVTAYDVVTRGDDELARVDAWLAAAQAAGIEPLVAFEHARGDATRCRRRSMRRAPQCRLPRVKEYERNLRQFLARFPQVRAVIPWNEINHFTQPTARAPRTAARFASVAARLCRGCTVVTADILDQADNPRAKRPTFKDTVRYIRRYRAALKLPRRVCGIHNYSDVNRFRDSGTRTIIRALGCREIWLTETGGIYRFGSSFKPNARRQARATRYMFTLARRHRRIKRVYVFNWFGKATPRFDAGLVADGAARPALAEVVKRVR